MAHGEIWVCLKIGDDPQKRGKLGVNSLELAVPYFQTKPYDGLQQVCSRFAVYIVYIIMADALQWDTDKPLQWHCWMAQQEKSAYYRTKEESLTP